MKLLHADADSFTLQVFRSYVFGLWAVYLLWFQLEDFAGFPPSYADPVGPLKAFPEFVTQSVMFDRERLILLRWTTIAVCILAAFPSTFLATGPVACVLLTLGQAYVRSFSLHMNHNELALLFSTYFLVGFGVLDAIQESQKSLPKLGCNPNSNPLVASAFFLLLTYCLVAWTRLVNGRWEVFSTDLLVWQTLRYSRSPEWFEPTLGQHLLDHPWIVWSLRISFPLVTLIELLAPLALVNRPFRLIFLVVITGFHLGVWVLMRIAFFENVLLLPLLLELQPILSRIRAGIFAARRPQ